MPSYAPFFDPKAKHFERTSVPDLTKAYADLFCPEVCSYIPPSLFDRKNLLVACDPRFGFVFFGFPYASHTSLTSLS